MKKLMTVLFAGAMLASVSAASAGDQWAEERLKAKTGRYSPAEETRRALLAGTVKHAPEECQAACCREHSASPNQSSATAARPTSEFLKAKLGRGASAPASHDQTQHAAANTKPSPSNAWARAKFGRDLNLDAHVEQAPPSTETLAACHMCGRTACSDRF